MKKVEINDNLNIEINRMQIVCDLFDDSGNPIGSPNQVVELSDGELETLDISGFQPLLDKFQQSGSPEA